MSTKITKPSQTAKDFLPLGEVRFTENGFIDPYTPEDRGRLLEAGAVEFETTSGITMLLIPRLDYKSSPTMKALEYCDEWDVRIIFLRAGDGEDDIVGGPITETGWYLLPACNQWLCCRPIGPFPDQGSGCLYSRVHLVNWHSLAEDEIRGDEDGETERPAHQTEGTTTETPPQVTQTTAKWLQ
jgi:hypothetical protein